MSSSLIVVLIFAVFVITFWLATKSIKFFSRKYPNADPSHKLAGVGGWLLFFIFHLMVLVPLIGAGSLESQIKSSESVVSGLASYAPWISYKYYLWSAHGVVAFVSIIAALILIRSRTRSAIYRVIAMVWLVGLLDVIFNIAAVVVFKVSDIISLGVFPGILVGKFTYALVWTAYLLLSRRVKATYGSGKPSLIGQLFEVKFLKSERGPVLNWCIKMSFLGLCLGVLFGVGRSDAFAYVAGVVVTFGFFGVIIGIIVGLISRYKARQRAGAVNPAQARPEEAE